MTHAHELRGKIMGGKGVPGRGENWGHCNSIINKIYLNPNRKRKKPRGIESRSQGEDPLWGRILGAPLLEAGSGQHPFPGWASAPSVARLLFPHAHLSRVGWGSIGQVSLLWPSGLQEA